MANSEKKRASRLPYMQQNQLTLPGFELPFDKHLDPNNRWVKLCQSIPWDKIVNLYLRSMSRSPYGTTKINPRMVLGAVIIKHYMNYTDRETIESISENVYMQYFVGLSSFCTEPIFDASLFVSIRERLNEGTLNEINEMVVKYWHDQNQTVHHQDERKTADEAPKNKEGEDGTEQNDECNTHEDRKAETEEIENAPTEKEITHGGTLITDATACPQAIAYPTDIKLLHASRESLEQIIDSFHHYEVKTSGDKKVEKVRTYRENARKDFLKIAQDKNPGKKKIRKGIKKQLNYIKRNLKHIDQYLLRIPMAKAITAKQQNYLLRVDLIYAQQKAMFDNHTHTVDDRIVNLHQPHVRPMVRGKIPNKVEFGAKIQISVTGDGLCYLDYLSWDAFNESQYLIDSIEQYRRRQGYYPKEVLADQIYCTRINRAWIKAKGIKLKAKPLGRKSALSNQVSPGERNPIEGKIGQGKLAYGLGRIKAKLSSTSESWIASIVLVLNLVKLAGHSAYCLIFRWKLALKAQLYGARPMLALDF